MSSSHEMNNLGAKVQGSKRSDQAEYEMVKALDRMRIIEKHQKAFDKLGRGTMDMPGFLRQLGPDMVMGLLQTLEDEKVSTKVKTQIRQDLLDRAGHSKITKAINLSASVDPQTTKRELVNLIMTKATAAGVKVEREDEIEGNVIDGDAHVVSDGSGE